MTDKTLNITSHTVPFTVRILTEGDKYGLRDALTHDKAEPLVEFYDQRYPHTQYGQFVSSYYLSTLLKGEDGINLYGGVDSWYIEKNDLNKVREWLKTHPATQSALLNPDSLIENRTKKLKF
jgi:hypothetical protein